MIIGMRGHDFGRMEPRALAAAIRKTGFEATQLAFTKAFPAPAEQYMTREALCDIREAFAGLALPVMGCYVSASDRDPDALAEAKARFKRALSASVTLGAGCVGTETTHFTFPESEREAAYARLLDFTREVCAHAEQVNALVGIEPVALHTLHTPELTRRLIADVNSPNLRVILDTANLVTPETAAPEAQMEILTQIRIFLTMQQRKLAVRIFRQQMAVSAENCRQIFPKERRTAITVPKNFSFSRKTVM